METTYERLGAILAKHHKVPAACLSPDASLESLGIDSLGTLELFWNIEEEFRISLPTEPVPLQTVHDVVCYVDELVAGHAAARTSGDAAPAPAASGA